LREEAASIDPSQPVFDVRSMSARVQETWGTQRLLSFLFSAFAGLALLLASVGLYGVIAYNALKRIREIGLRLALGAQPRQIVTLIFSHGMQLLLIGSLIGVVTAQIAARGLQSVLFAAKPIDLMTSLSVAAMLFVTTFLACWIPARRASRIDPMVALREE
jgi:putative ABC transport system permease protein